MKQPAVKKKLVNYVNMPTKIAPNTPWDNLFDPRGYKSKEALELEEANKAAESEIARLKNKQDKEDIVTGNAKVYVKGGAPLKDVFEQKGSITKTIYTSNPSDPRIKSTKDSLDLYNKHQGGKLKQYNYNPLQGDYRVQKPEAIKKQGEIGSRGNADKMQSEVIDKLYPKIKPIAVVGMSDGWDEYAFKKPSTSVVYKKDNIPKNEPSKKPLKLSDLNPNTKSKLEQIKDTGTVVTKPRYTQVQKGKWMRPVELNRKATN
jgi:hypothetical protein